MENKTASTCFKFLSVGSGIVNIHLYTPSTWHFYIHRRLHSWLSVVYVRLGRADKNWGGVRGAKPQKSTSRTAWERPCLEAVTWQKRKQTFKNTHYFKKKIKPTEMGKSIQDASQQIKKCSVCKFDTFISSEYSTNVEGKQW